MLFLDDVAYYLTNCGCIPLHLARLASLAYNLIRVMVPVVLIIVGMITLTKSILGQKDDDLKKAQTSVIKKVVAAVLVFLVMTLVQYILTTITKTMPAENKDSKMWECITYMLTGEGNPSTSEVCNVIDKDMACIYNPVTVGNGSETVDYDRKIKYTASAKIGSLRVYTMNGDIFSPLASNGETYTEIACPKYWVQKSSGYTSGPNSTYYAYDVLTNTNQLSYILKLGS